MSPAVRLQVGLGLAAGAAGCACAAAGLHAYRDVRRALARERVSGVGGGVPAGTPVRSAATARALAETIRERTLDATEGLTYAEVPSYVDAAGAPTSDADAAVSDERTGAPVRNPQVELWLQSMTLQSALMQAYTGFRLAQLTTAVGGALAAVGLGLALDARR